MTKWFLILSDICLPLAAFWIGYQYPRDLELESTAPVEFHYEITKEAARELILKSVEGCPTSPTD